MERGVTQLDALRWLNVVVWAGLILFMIPGAWGATWGKTGRRGDPMRLACLATGIVMLGFNLRWLFFPDNLMLWQILYVLAAADAVYILLLARVYGRGPLL